MMMSTEFTPSLAHYFYSKEEKIKEIYQIWGYDKPVELKVKPSVSRQGGITLDLLVKKGINT